MKACTILGIALSLTSLALPARADLLQGTITSAGKPAANVTIVIRPINVTTQTDSLGRYRVNLPPGAYTVTIQGKPCKVTVSGTTELNGC
jgi:hypothetical protein